MDCFRWCSSNPPLSVLLSSYRRGKKRQQLFAAHWPKPTEEDANDKHNNHTALAAIGTLCSQQPDDDDDLETISSHSCFELMVEVELTANRCLADNNTDKEAEKDVTTTLERSFVAHWSWDDYLQRLWPEQQLLVHSLAANSNEWGEVRRALLKHHPDKGGSDTAAFEEALRSLRRRRN